jgi:uncharacterized tellurite resistance protein B-like protein
MLQKIRRFFEDRIDVDRNRQMPQDEEHRLRLATAALLFEISRADTDVSDSERQTIVTSVQKVFNLDDDETRELVALAEEKVETSVSLYQFTSLVNDRFSAQEKNHVVELLWRVSFADGELDKYEEHLIRKIADLLHVSHADYIQARHRVTGE